MFRRVLWALWLCLFSVQGMAMEFRGVKALDFELPKLGGALRKPGDYVIFEESGDRTTGCFIDDIRDDARRLCRDWGRGSSYTVYIIDYHGTFRYKGGLLNSDVGAKKKCTYNIRVGCVASEKGAFYEGAKWERFELSDKGRREHDGDSFYLNPRSRELKFKSLVSEQLKIYLRKLQTKQLWMQRVHNTVMKHQIEKDLLLAK